MSERRYSQHHKVRLEERADGQPKIVGYAAVYYDGTRSTEFELWPGLRERIAPGAFDNALAPAGEIVGLLNHDPSSLLGRRSAGTMRVTSDSVGLRYEIDVPDTQIGRDTVESIRRQDLGGSSFSFEVRNDGQEFSKSGDGEIRTLTDLNVGDVGPVTFPAYDATTTSLRSRGEDGEARSAYDAWKAGQASAAVLRRSYRLRALEVSEKA